jgi:hypothetical protein
MPAPAKTITISFFIAHLLRESPRGLRGQGA